MLLSYLLFSKTLSLSVAGACPVGAGSDAASWLGEPDGSVRAGPPLVLPIAEAELGFLDMLSPYSRDCINCLLRRISSILACLSAFMPCLAK